MSRKMKDSGIDYVGDIPFSWKVIPNKYVMKKKKDICDKWNNENVLSLTMNGVIIRDLINPVGKMPTTFDGYQYVYPNDLLMCLFDIDVTPRCIGIVKNFGVTSPSYSRFTLYDGYCTKYYYYYYLYLDNKKELLHLAKNLRHSFTEEELGYLKTPVPPFSEQQKIADFLDEKVKEIDNAIEKTKKTIELYKKYKQALIDKMCIHGFDEKETSSNIEYFNKIPIRWSVMKCSYIFYESVSSPKKSDISLSLSQIDGVIPTKEMKESSLKTSTYDNWKHVDKNDLVLNRFKGHLGVIFSSKYEGMVSFHYGVYKSKYSINSKFFEYLFHTSNYKKVLSMQSNGMTVGLQNLSNSNFYSIKLLVPSLDVQNKITKYLDEKSKKINNLINAKQKIINELELYKKSLIYEYVTGKKEVK